MNKLNRLTHLVSTNRLLYHISQRELMCRVTVTPQPFERYHSLWHKKSIAHENRIANLPIPTPNKHIIPLIDCIIHHIIENGPCTLDQLWRGIKSFGVVRSKRKLQKQILKWHAKYPDKLPFVNINNINNIDGHATTTTSSSQFETNLSEMDSEIEGETSSNESDFDSDNEINENNEITNKTVIFDISPNNREKIVDEYNDKWIKIWKDIETNNIELLTNNKNSWFYSIHQNKKPCSKGPLTWKELIERVQTDKKKKKYNNNSHFINSTIVTNKTPIYNFQYSDEWNTLDTVVKDKQFFDF